MFYEDLPKNCPPDEANPVDNKIFYRLVDSNPPNDSDFLSHRKKWPYRKFGVSECQARSLSIYNDKDECEIVLRKFKNLQNKITAEITLTLTDGPILQTSDNLKHHSWWRSRSFQLSVTLSSSNDKT